MPALTISDLTKRYETETAVEDLSLEIETGEVYGFLGPNGAGKSTTINILMDYVRPTTGDIQILGYDPHDDLVDVHQRVGILPDRFSVYGRLTGRQHLEYIIDSKGAADTPEKLLARVGLEGAIDQQAGEYSRGMQQRLALAMALVGSPELLILDEPFTGLDPHGARAIRDLVNEENERGVTIFFSSHVLGQVEMICDRIGILHDGHLISEGRIDELRSDAGVEATVSFVVSDLSKRLVDAVDSLDSVTGTTTADNRIDVQVRDDTARIDVLATIESAGGTVETFSVREPSVEEIFTAYTGDR
ncbi:ABC transporter ATP-binding protein [Haloferax mucosum ATCC BAA-1512]|uniref:ABC transporter ATP-binding protein n=1 Tax=Haloferax mucosum ATCC BAA-1512 TaxID=662479 RepID=M0IGJ6_9EURY|nr:ABC transporter ATP-binding protein [Haloferax mucosum]ELZ95905.1 ABC transporter ATP-binding protein [Haloferax mucosum ATCC BAA-1512]